MTNTIEVPISLIKTGDMDAIRELLPKENLFGRWATHSDYGRGFISSAYPNLDGFIRFNYKNEGLSGRAILVWTSLDDLTLDLVELTTMKDFRTAPEGTIVAEPTGNSFQKVSPERWESVNGIRDDKQMAISGPHKILRYGWGD